MAFVHVLIVRLGEFQQVIVGPTMTHVYFLLRIVSARWLVLRNWHTTAKHDGALNADGLSSFVALLAEPRNREVCLASKLSLPFHVNIEVTASAQH